MKKTEKQMSDSFFMGILLAIVGGYLDAYTYIARGQVFANAQTGNIVLLGMNIAYGNVIKALSYLPPIFAFMAGIFIAEKIKKHSRKTFLHWRQSVLLVELAVIILVTLMPSGKQNGINYDMTANVLISFVCSLQVQSFRRISGVVCATTMCTGNLRSATEGLSLYMSNHDRKALSNSLKYFGIVAFFVIGAVISTYLTTIFWTHSVVFSAAGLIAAILLMFISPDTHPQATP